MKRILLAAGIIYLFAAAGCKKGYLDINTNPNNPADVIPELVLPSALNATAARQVNAFTFVSGWMGQWAVSGSYAPSTTNFSTYKETTDFGEGLWATIYNNLEDYQYVEQKAIQQNKPFYQGAAKIMKAHDFQQLVDMFGNVPYFNALQGTANLQPVYDDQVAIYEDLIVQIDSGISYIEASAGAGVPSGSDIMFNGDVTAWTQFANSLKLRILIRQTEVGRDGYIQSNIDAIHGGYLEDDAGVNPGYTNSAGKQNPFYSVNYNTSGTYINDFWRANDFAIDFFFDPIHHDSARGAALYAFTPTSLSANKAYFSSDDYLSLTPEEKALIPADTLLVWQGNDIGSTSGYVGSNSSAFGPANPTVTYGPGVSYSTHISSSVSQKAIVMSAAESYFLQAEAALRGFIDDDPEVLYHKGVEASFSYLGVGGAEEYYSNPANSLAYWNEGQSFTYKLNLIIAQKWAAELNVTPLQVWCDYRRLPNLPFNKSIPLSVSPYVEPGGVPIRILYPTSEYSTNGENVPDQGAQAHHTDKLFWMP